MIRLSQQYINGMSGDSYQPQSTNRRIPLPSEKESTNTLGAWDTPTARRAIGQQDIGCIRHFTTKPIKSVIPFRGMRFE